MKLMRFADASQKSLRRLIVISVFMPLVTFKTALIEWKLYNIKNVVQLTFCYLHELFLVSILNAYQPSRIFGTYFFHCLLQIHFQFGGH